MKLVVLLLALSLAACQTRLPWDKPATFPGVRVIDNANVHTGDLLDAARPELESFAKNGRRKADADDAAYAMEALLRERGHPEGKVSFDVQSEQLLFRIQEGPLAHRGCVRFEPSR